MKAIHSPLAERTVLSSNIPRVLRTALCATALSAATAGVAHAAVYQIGGTFDSAASQGAYVWLQPAGSAATATFTETPVNVPVALEASWLDIQGNSIAGGTLNVSDYAIKLMVSPAINYGAALEFANVSHSFGPGGFSSTGTGAVPGSCVGTWVDACNGTYPGTTLVGYALSSTGANTYNLVLNFKGSVGQSIVHNYSLTATPAVPVPAAGWLFGSALVGVAGMARRNRKAA